MLPSVLSNSLRRRLYGLLVVSGLCLSGALALLFTLARSLTGTDPAVDTRYAIPGVLLGLVVLAWGRFFERYGAELVAQSYVQELRQLVLIHALRLPARYNPRIAKGGTLLRLTGDMGAVRNWIVQGMAPLMVLGSWLLASLIGLSLLHWSLALSALVPLTLAVVVNYLLGRQLYRVSESSRRRRAQMIRNVNEKLAAINVVRAFNQLGRESRRFERQGRRLGESLNQRARISGIIRGSNEALMLVTLVALVVCGQRLAGANLISQQEFALTLIAAVYLLANLRRLTRIYELWTLKRVATDKLESFLSIRPSARKGRSRNMSPGGSLPLEIEELSIPGRLPSITARMDTHDRILLDGPGGAGKSTVLKLLSGLEPVSQGQIRLNGVAQIGIDASSWSKAVALVSNELPLLRGTIHSNLCYGLRHFDDSYYQQVLELCGLDKLFETEQSPEFELTEGGLNLSSSSRYRLMLARALLRRPRYLLIDSHEAHLDRDIFKVLITVLQHFSGGLVLCSALTELQPYCTQRWTLSLEEGFSRYSLNTSLIQDSEGKAYVI